MNDLVANQIVLEFVPRHRVYAEMSWKSRLVTSTNAEVSGKCRLLSIFVQTTPYKGHMLFGQIASLEPILVALRRPVRPAPLPENPETFKKFANATCLHPSMTDVCHH
jgi:hypothetical protein